MDKIETRAREVLSGRNPERSPITALLNDDAFCHLLMTQRMGQGLRIPEQSDTAPHSARLAYLQALVDGDGIPEARAVCNGYENHMRVMGNILKKENPEPGELDVLKMFQDFTSRADSDSYWASLSLFYGEDRIPQYATPLHNNETSVADALPLVMRALERQPVKMMNISDRDRKTDAIGFIRIGKDPGHFTFPETASPKGGTNAGIYHYEIDHPGGDFALFCSLDLGGTHFRGMAEKAEDQNPLYINEGRQMMAVCSYYLQTLGLFHVPAGDTRVTLAGEDGILSAAVYHDWRHKADRVLEALTGEGITPSEQAAMSDFLTKAEVVGDYDWRVIEDLQARYPQILGHVIGMDRSYIFGGSRAQLEERILEACGGDTELAAADIAEALKEATIIDLPAGRHHLYVPNLYSKTRCDAGLAALDQACGNAHEDLWFVLADRELDLGDDPHMVTSMRRLPAEEPGLEPPSW